MLRYLVLCSSLVLCSCVEHRGLVQLDAGQQTAAVHVFQDGQLLSKTNEQPLEAGFSSPLPTEMHVDAWYRNEEGLIYRSHVQLKSPRPWWQRFPADLFTDALWPKTITVDAVDKLHFKAIESLEPSYLDQVAEAHGYGDNYNAPHEPLAD